MRRFWAFIIASIILHGLLGTGLVDVGNFNALSQKKTDKPIDVTLLSLPRSKNKDLGRVVLDAPVPQDLQVENQEDASLLSQRRQRVKKQSVAHDFGLTKNSLTQTPKDGKTGILGNDKQRSENENPGKTDKKRSAQSRASKELNAAGSAKKISGLILQTDPFGDIPIPKSRRGSQGTDSKNEKEKQDQANDQLTQRLQALNMGDGGHSMINEKILGVQSANITALNTNPYLYYSFYNRLVSQVRFHWENNLGNVIPSLGVMAAQRFPNRDEWLTQISLYMDNKGRVIKVDVDKSCGLTDLDYAIVRAMYAGGPYRNPPTEMQKDGQIRVQLNFSLMWHPSVMVNLRESPRGSEY